MSSHLSRLRSHRDHWRLGDTLPLPTLQDQVDPENLPSIMLDGGGGLSS